MRTKIATEHIVSKLDQQEAEPMTLSERYDPLWM